MSLEFGADARMAGYTARRICWAVGIHCYPHCVARVKFPCHPCTPVRQNAAFHPGDVGSVGGRPVKFRDGPRLQDLQVARRREFLPRHRVSANELLPQRRVREPRRGQAVLHGLRGGGSQREQGSEGGHERRGTSDGRRPGALPRRPLSGAGMPSRGPGAAGRSLLCHV